MRDLYSFAPLGPVGFRFLPTAFEKVATNWYRPLKANSVVPLSLSPAPPCRAIAYRRYAVWRQSLPLRNCV